jgi:hypothetical protein
MTNDSLVLKFTSRHVNCPTATIRAVIFGTDRSLAELILATNLAPNVIKRLARGKPNHRIDKFIELLEQLGIGIAIRSPCVPMWQMLVIPRSGLPLPQGNLLITLIQRAIECVHNSEISLILSPFVRQRLRKGQLPPVVAAVLRLLSAVSGEMVAVGGDGCVRLLTLPITATVGRTVKTPHKRIYSSMPNRGTLKVSKSEVLRLRREFNLTYASIATIVGVSAERVRQIVMLLGAPSARRHQRELRKAACMGSLAEVAATVEFQPLAPSIAAPDRVAVGSSGRSGA